MLGRHCNIIVVVDRKTEYAKILIFSKTVLCGNMVEILGSDFLYLLENPVVVKGSFIIIDL